MNFKYTILIAFTCLSCTYNSLLAQVQMPSKGDSPKRISLNGTWKFMYIPSSKLKGDSLFHETTFDDKQWENIKTPGNWELQGFAEPIYHKKLKEGTGLYRTNFSIPTNWNGSPIYIAFDGVAFGYTFWVNGQYAGEFSSAFNRQTFDISSLVTAGKTHSLAVKVITHPKGWEFDTNDDWSLSGIYRDVTVFSLNPVHIKDVLLQTFLQADKANLHIKADVEKTNSASFSKNIKLVGQLINAAGKTVNTFTILPDKKASEESTIAFSQVVKINYPALWSAEKPSLYTLRLTLKDESNVLQEYSEHVGIREISWANGVLKLNGSPIKLRGATHHDLSPINGRAITEAEIKHDLKLMREANINFIRTSHYPPNPRLLALCDSLGFYVDDEVPYGFGDEHLKDSTYLPNLLQRAKSTIWRDKNHPSIIFWSVGNENPVTKIGLKTGEYVKSLDPTRPYCFPQGPTDFREMLVKHPMVSDILAPHYLVAAELRELAKTIKQPLVMTEYAHALGLDFNSADEIYDVMYTNPTLAGGAVWEFVDQGILRKSPKKPNKDEKTTFVWPTENTFYDTADNQGTDGIVYSDRTPQVDYFQLRKVYAPVRALDTDLTFKSGKQTFQIKVVNRYDFTNLSAVKCKWQVWGDNSLLSSGTIPMNCLPHDTLVLNIVTSLPEKPTTTIHYLKLMFEDNAHYQFYEKSYTIHAKELNERLTNISTPKASKPIKSGESITSENYRFDFVKETGGIQLKNSQGEIIISEGLFARVGRKPSMAQNATIPSKRSKLKHTLWAEHLLSKPTTQVKTFDAKQLIINDTFFPDSSKERSISGDIAYTFAENGQINIDYNFVPIGKEEAVETGVSMLIPATFTEFRWVGKGPYAAYPGKEKLSDYGIYHLNSNDLYFAGNRQHVDCAVFTDLKGNGFAILADKANIAVERTEKGIVVSHNAHVSSTFNKYEWPDNLYSFKNAKGFSGNFKILPFTAETWPTILKNLFGESKKTVKPFQPFYHSYDQ